MAMTSDPYVVLGVDEDAGDDAVKQRYLALVRAYPPDRAPERFQLYRAAYEALADEHARLEVRLLRTNGAALTRLKSLCLAAAAPTGSRASKANVAALLAEGINRF